LAKQNVDQQQQALRKERGQQKNELEFVNNNGASLSQNGTTSQETCCSHPKHNNELISPSATKTSRSRLKMAIELAVSNFAGLDQSGCRLECEAAF
jgi:hypothetical protein